MMTHIRPTKIEAALLYQDYAPFRYGTLLERLKLVFGDEVEIGLGHCQDGQFGVIRIGGHCAIVSQNDHALGPAGFQAAIKSPYMQMHHPDAAQIVQSHRKNIFVTVGGSDVLIPDDVLAGQSTEMQKIIREATPAPKTPSVALFSERVFVTRILISTLIDMNTPDIVHWCQSDQFFKPTQLKPADDPRGMALQIHPSLFSTGKDENGHVKIGFHAFGSEHVMGHHVFVEETPLSVEAVIPAIHDVIYAISQDGNLPKDGSTIRLKTGAELRFSMMPANNRHPRPYIAIAVLRLGATPDDRVQRHAGLQPKPKPQPPAAAPKPQPFRADVENAFGKRDEPAKPKGTSATKRYAQFMGGLFLFIFALQFVPG